MTDIPQPVNFHPGHSPTTLISRHHGLRINVHAQDDQSDQPAQGDVSPITPQESHQQRLLRDERPVSPIETASPPVPRAPLHERPFQSQIPRKKVGSNQAKATKETRWDEYSGEPTTDEGGKPASVRPGTQRVEMQFPHLKERTKLILAGLREREAAKTQPWGKVPPPVPEDPLDRPTQREPWKGASGRSAIVEPVRNTPSARQGSIQFSKRTDSLQHTPQRPVEHLAPANVAAPSPQSRSPALDEEIKPIEPLIPEKRIKTPELVTKQIPQSPESQSLAASPESLLRYQDTIPETSHPRVESPQYEEEPKTPTTPIAVENAHIISKAESQPAYEPPEIDREQSRFSWTTYTTSAAESPRSLAQVMRDSSPPPPMPDLPPAIKVKKRPVSSSPFMHSSPYSQHIYADSSPSVVRKPLSGTGSRTLSMSSATSRAMSTSKSLPPTPTVLEASDKVGNLEAQLEGLRRQKHNILRILSDLNASLRKNAVVYDMWKRKEVEKNITYQRMQLDDVDREIHDVSLQLHRVQRKRDRDDGYEDCTGLWIKRVTS